MLQHERSGVSKWRKLDDRRAELKRMRAIATLLLVAMTIVFVATTITKQDQPWIPYLRAFSEAAMVGACADWFAIVALFRRPFGLPIPHTGIIPANQKLIGEALGRFITNNFLTRETTSRKLIEMDVAGSIARWLNEPVNAGRLAHYGSRLLPEILTHVPRQRLSAFVASLSRRAAQSIPAALLASRILEILWAQGQTQALLDRALEHGRDWLAGHKDLIQKSVVQRSARWVPKFVDALLAERIMTGLLATIEDMRNPNHVWRVELKQAVEKLIADLATNPTMRARGEALKAELLASPTFLAQMELLWLRIEEGLYSDVPGYAEVLSGLMEAALRGLAKGLHDDPELAASANRRIRVVVLRSIFSRRIAISTYIARVVQGWDASTLVGKLELQVGKDLQYIRINGTLVGGLVGLIIFAITKWLQGF
jgi:uncharacterized membrane-anchored protein YjiN (DUF445 family)